MSSHLVHRSAILPPGPDRHAQRGAPAFACPRFEIVAHWSLYALKLQPGDIASLYTEAERGGGRGRRGVFPTQDALRRRRRSTCSTCSIRSPNSATPMRALAPFRASTGSLVSQWTGLNLSIIFPCSG